MKLQKTRQFASIYLLTFCVLGFVLLSGCAQRSSTFSLADIDPSLLKSEGRHLKLHTLEHKNLIKEISLYTEAYLSYYKAENGNAHPAKSDFTFNLITLFDKETPSKTPAKEFLKALITHCQSN